MRILVVCRANMFRSPLAAALLAQGAERRGLSFEIASAGLEAPRGLPAALEVRTLAPELGCDLELHFTRQVDPATVERADLVLVMEPKQVRAIQGLHREPERTRVECLAAYLPKYRGSESTATICDPAGRPRAEMRRVAAELVEAVESFLDVHAGRVDS